MKHILVLLSVFLTTSTFAAKTIKLNTTLVLDHTLLGKTRIILEEGKTARISERAENGDGYVIEITPTLLPKKVVSLNFKVNQVLADKIVVVSEPKIITHLGKQAEITVGDKHDPKKLMHLGITVTS